MYIKFEKYDKGFDTEVTYIIEVDEDRVNKVIEKLHKDESISNLVTSSVPFEGWEIGDDDDDDDDDEGGDYYDIGLEDNYDYLSDYGCDDCDKCDSECGCDKEESEE